MKNQPFYKEARLMLETIPAVATENCFALKGGTAINFFVRDMPRLSIDIDLTYLPIEDGVKTPEGKAISSQNAIKHGILARCTTKYDLQENASLKKPCAGYLRTRNLLWAF